MERTEIGIGNMKIDVVDDNAVYINLNGYTYYIDDSTNEQHIEKKTTRTRMSAHNNINTHT